MIPILVAVLVSFVAGGIVGGGGAVVASGMLEPLDM